VWFRPSSGTTVSGAERRRVKFVYVNPTVGDALDVRRLDQPAVGLHRREADVVEHDVEDVRRAVRAIGWV